MKWATKSRRRDLLFFLVLVVGVAFAPPAASQTLYYDDMVYDGDVANGKPHSKGRLAAVDG